MKRIQYRSLPSATLAIRNPVLADGEIVVESDTGRRKVGNGRQNWQALPYLPGEGAPPSSPVEGDGLPVTWKGGNVSAWNFGAFADIPGILAEVEALALNVVTVPVRVSSDGSLVTVVQGSAQHAAQLASAIVSTFVGERALAPDVAASTDFADFKARIASW